MNTHIRALCFFVLGIIPAVLAFPFQSRAGAADRVDATDTLAGVKAVYVQIQPIASNLGNDRGLMRRLKRNTENQLRKAGIELLSEKAYSRLSRTEQYPLARLFIALSIYNTGRMDEKMYSIAVQARQLAFLARKPVIKLMSPTWEKRKIGIEDNPEVVVGLVANMIERFIGDFKMANPRQ